MTTYRFEEIARTGRKNLPCPSCGKKVRRQQAFTMTLNPYNRDPETGLPRTRSQISAALGEQVREYEQQPVTCTPCEHAGGAA
jgi:hypothetical protein